MNFKLCVGKRTRLFKVLSQHSSVQDEENQLLEPAFGQRFEPETFHLEANHYTVIFGTST